MFFLTRHHWIIVILSFLLAFALQSMPWPDNLNMFRPSWVQLILIYWVITLPHRINVGVAFLVGLVADVFLGSTLGIRGLTYGLLSFVCVLIHDFMRNIALWHQIFIVLVLSLAVEVLIYWVSFLASTVEYHPELFLRSIINALIWPWLYILLNKLRTKFSIN
ncbi:rod shape-determining protein MreD [Thorsellia kenyensis]|uniref:Rod shape-determining protein MreD n=1 Tax=Thorsellia kenyensis TaxID=1549888 RepID=A0ABV6CB80_9GAMM